MNYKLTVKYESKSRSDHSFIDFLDIKVCKRKMYYSYSSTMYIYVSKNVYSTNGPIFRILTKCILSGHSVSLSFGNVFEEKRQLLSFVSSGTHYKNTPYFNLTKLKIKWPVIKRYNLLEIKFCGIV